MRRGGGGGDAQKVQIRGWWRVRACGQQRFGMPEWRSGDEFKGRRAAEGGGGTERCLGCLQLLTLRVAPTR